MISKESSSDFREMLHDGPRCFEIAAVAGAVGPPEYRNTRNTLPEDAMQTHARVVVIGGGMMGAGLLYHLAEEGWTDILLVEKGELTSGSTWHAAGQCPSFIADYNMAKIHDYGVRLYPKLEEKTGQYVSWHGCGGIRFALKPAEVEWFHHVASVGKLIGFHCEIIDPEKIKQINPFVNVEGVLAGAWTTGDGHVDPAGCCNALAKGARDMGATISRRTRVTDVKQRPGGEWEVVTDQGNVVCEMVVNAAGCYARQVSRMAGTDVPITNMEHTYLVTEPIREFLERDEEMVVMRDPYASAYYRQEQKAGLIGIYEPVGSAECWSHRGGWPEWDSGERAVRGGPRPACPLRRAGAGSGCRSGAMPASSASYAARSRTPPMRTRCSARPRGLKNFWQCCGASIGIASGAGLWQVPRAVDGARGQRDQHGGRRPAPVRRPRPRGVHEGQVPPGLRAHVRPAPARGGAPRVTRGAGHAVVRQARREGLRVHGGERLGAPEVVFARRPGGGGRIPAQQRLRGGGRGVPGGARAGGGAGSVELREVRRNRAGSRGVPEHDHREPHAEATRRHRARALPLGRGPHRRRVHDHPARPGPLLRAVGRRAPRTATWTLLSRDRATGTTSPWPTSPTTGGCWCSPGRARARVLAKITDTELGNEHFRWLTGKEIEVAGGPGFAHCGVNYVGELGWELHCPMERLADLYDAVVVGRGGVRHRGLRDLRGEFAAHGEGVPGLGGGAHQRDHPGGGGHGALRRLRQGRLHRQDGDAAG